MSKKQIWEQRNLQNEKRTSSFYSMEFSKLLQIRPTPFNPTFEWCWDQIGKFKKIKNISKLSHVVCTFCQCSKQNIFQHFKNFKFALISVKVIDRAKRTKFGMACFMQNIFKSEKFQFEKVKKIETLS